jgi:uncharacterized protein YuzE
MTRRFLLRLTVDIIADMAYLDFAESDRRIEFRGFRKLAPGVEPEERSAPAVALHRDSDGKIGGIVIPNPSRHLGLRFQTLEDDAVFPVDLTVDTVRDRARIVFRETSLEIEYHRDEETSTVRLKELPVETTGTVQDGPVRIHYGAEDRILAITIVDISNQLQDRFVSARADEC